MERAVVYGSIAKEGHRYTAGLHQLRAIATTARLQDAGSTDAAGPHHADLGRKEMHRAAAPARAARHPTEEFGHQLLRRHALGQRVTVTAMRAEDWIVVIEMCADTGGDRFLTDVGVASAMNHAALMAAGEFFFGVANCEHCAKQAQQLSAVRKRAPAVGRK